MAGRPSDYTDELAGLICAKLAQGVPLVRMCREEGMPSVVTVYAWLAKHRPFLNMYAQARADQADTLADEIIDIADDSARDTITTEDGREIPNTEWINRSRLRVDARKWVAAKLKPKKYGDSLAVGGSDDMPPLKVTAVDVRG